jgi:pilus assembly protein Flp/PilA
MPNIKNFLSDESGASAAEYVLILALIGVVIIVGAGLIGQSMNTAMTTTAGKIDTAMK